jgi:FkbM family methyltransferase
MRGDAAFLVYERVLERYKRRTDSVSARLAGAGIGAAAALLGRWQGIGFPERAVGGWWWVERYRFEFLMGWNERAAVTRVQAIVQPGMIVVDVGAHIGYYTRLFARLAGPTGRVIAFEPHPENFAILRRNVPQSRFPNVTLLECAVGDRNGSLPLYLSPGHSNHSLVRGYTQDVGAIDVQCVTLDSALAQQGIEGIDFLKTDTEGAEMAVLAGASETARRSPRLAMLVELHPAALRCAGVAPEQLVAHLEQMGFVSELLSDAATADVYGDLLCTRA